jgi:hypothetical protein
MAKVDCPNDLMRWDIDDEHLLAVGSWIADSGIAIDRNICGAAVRRSFNFVSRDALLWNYYLTSISHIDERESAILLIRDKKYPRLLCQSCDREKTYGNKGGGASKIPHMSLTFVERSYTNPERIKG